MAEPSPTAQLREPFPPEVIGKLPKGGTMLDYVGHAAVTDRLLQVDPEWTWEPMAYAPDGGPLIRQEGTDSVLWIRLTVAGMTRPGVGIAATKSFELSKQLISDAIRNAAMRFGVALDLWSKEDLHAATPEPVVATDVAESLAETLNAAGPDARKRWMARFGCKPADLPASQEAEALAFTGQLEILEDGEGEA